MLGQCWFLGVYLKQHTCSRTLQTLLPSPVSRRDRSNITRGVSGPLVSRDREAFKLDPPTAPARKAYPPSKTSDCRALSRVFSLLSPSRSMRPPPGGRNATRSCRSTTLSTCVEETEEVEAVGELLACPRARDFVATSGRKEGSAARVAVERWLF